jgi:hypothetical protein
LKIKRKSTWIGNKYEVNIFFTKIQFSNNASKN